MDKGGDSGRFKEMRGCRRITKFRLGNETKEGRYWEGEEERKEVGYVGMEWNHGSTYGKRVGIEM